MMKTETMLSAIARPALALLGPAYEGQAAERMLLAIAYQESGLQHRMQIGGPARGLWQFEMGGGVKGVLSHASSSQKAEAVARELLYDPNSHTVYEAIADNDLLACCFARLLLWTDPRPLPTTEAEGWNYYIRNWRPGKPHPERWPRAWSLYGG